MMQRRTRSDSNEVLLLVQRAASVGRRLKDVQGDVHCGIQRDNVVYWKTKRKINDDLQCN